MSVQVLLVIADMKAHLRYTTLALFASFLLAPNSLQAQSEFFFSEAQPKNTYNEEHIPSDFHGIWRSNKDSLISLIIRDTAIITRALILYTTTLEKINSKKAVYIEHGLLHGISSKGPFPMTEVNDTIYFFYPHESTLFSMNGAQLLRKHENALVLNYLEKETYWSALLLSKTAEGGLEMAAIDLEGGAAAMPLLGDTKTPEGEDSIIARPDRRQFREFIAAGGFSDRQQYSPQQ